MKSYSKILAPLFAALLLVGCSPKAKLTMVVDGAPSTKLAVHKLNVNSSVLLDSVKTDRNGRFSYSVAVEKGQPEFVYIYMGDTRLAALLLDAGEKVTVEADTLGNYSVEGSAGSSDLKEAEDRQARFVSDMALSPDSGAAAKLYVEYYRDMTRFVMSHSTSLAVVPVLFQNLNTDIPVFNQSTDAILFRKVTDSLKTAYPQSKYVKALERETVRRENNLSLRVAIGRAEQAGFPDLLLPDINSEKISLAGLDSKVVLLHFWDVTDPAQKLFNTDVLLPLYATYHKKGLEIYSVCISNDKALWASVVKNQDLPWVNVCDGYGAACPALGLYNIQALPSSILIADGDLKVASISGEDGLRKELKKLLK